MKTIPQVLLRDHLLAFVRCLTEANEGQMTLSRRVTDTYPDPAKTSYNDMVSWSADITFGRGYFTGAMVRYVGRWAEPHPTPQFGDDVYGYSEMSNDLPLEEAVDTFLAGTIPDWALPK
jgi:hypothetical protein